MSLPLLVDRDGNAIGSSREEKEAAPEANVLKAEMTLDRLLASAIYDPAKAGVEVTTMVYDAVRKNPKRPALIMFAAPDFWSMNAKGDPELQNMYIALKLDRSWVDAMLGKVAEE